MGRSARTNRYAAGAVLALALAGCGDGRQAADVKIPAAQAISLASQKTAAADSYKVDLTVGGAAQVHGTIQVRLRPSLAVNAALDRASFGGVSLPGGERAIIVGNELYAKLPFGQMASGGKPWIRLPISSGGNGVDINQLIQQANPADQMKILTDSGDARRVGTETIDGVSTTHYRGTITPRQAVARLDAKTRSALGGLNGSAGDQKVGFDLWVDQDNLPRKLVSAFVTPAGHTTATMIFSDYNKHVSVSAPPADQVTDAPQLGHIPG